MKVSVRLPSEKPSTKGWPRFTQGAISTVSMSPDTRIVPPGWPMIVMLIAPSASLIRVKGNENIM